MPIWIISLIGQVVVPLLTHLLDGAKAAPTVQMNAAELVDHEANVACLDDACTAIHKLKL